MIALSQLLTDFHLTAYGMIVFTDGISGWLTTLGSKMKKKKKSEEDLECIPL